jgi:folate-binding protein YgfZ
VGAPAAVGTPVSVSTNRGYLEQDGVGIAAVDGSGRQWAVGTPEALRRRGLTVADEQAWRLADIRAGLPQIYLATREAFVAQMLNLDRLDGISFSKGCYTGQEIIARTQHLGRIKRRLYRLRLPEGEWTLGQPLRLTDGRTGRLVELARSAEGVEALAVLTVETSATPEGDASPNETTASGTGVTPVGVTPVGAIPIDAVQLSLPYSLS